MTSSLQPLDDRLRAVLTVLAPGSGRMALLVVQDASVPGDSIATRLDEADIRALLVALAKPTLQ